MLGEMGFILNVLTLNCFVLLKSLRLSDPLKFWINAHFFTSSVTRRIKRRRVTLKKVVSIFVEIKNKFGRLSIFFSSGKKLEFPNEAV